MTTSTRKAVKAAEARKLARAARKSELAAQRDAIAMSESLTVVFSR